MNKNGTKIYFNSNYYYRRYTAENINNGNLQNIINDIKIISIACLDEIVNYKFIKGELNNHNIMIIYDKNDVPVACNVAFTWKYLEHKVMHLGLYLVSKTHQRLGFQQKLGLIQILLAMVENNFNIYFTDIGRSATGFKAIDYSSFLYNYPSIKNEVYDKKFIHLSKKIAESLYLNHSVDWCCVSSNSTYDKELMVIKNSNEKEGGGFYALTNHLETRNSKNQLYNEFVEKLCPSVLDDFIIIIKPSFKNDLFYNVYLTIKLGFIMLFVVINMLQYSIVPSDYLSKFIYNKFLFKIVTYLLNLKIKIHGDKSKLKEEQLLVLCNHYQGLDFFVIYNLFNNCNRPLYTVAKNDIVGSSDDQNIISSFLFYIKNTFIRSNSFIPYKRGDKEDGKVVKNIIIDKLNSKNNILLFPEGTTRRDGIPKDFKHGIFKLSIENKLKILPISIKYSEDIGIQKGDPLVLFDWIDNKVDVYIHDIIDCEKEYNESKENDYLELKDKVLHTICSVFNK